MHRVKRLPLRFNQMLAIKYVSANHCYPYAETVEDRA